MKKFFALFASAVLLVSLCACNSNPYSKDGESDFSKKLDSGEYGTFVCVYSGQGNDDKSDDEIFVKLDVAYENTDYYSADGTLVQFPNGKFIYDENGEKIDEESLQIGDLLVIYCNQEIYSKAPVTVKAFKAEKMKVEVQTS